ncbi:TFIIH basal transcription factor complex p47 subunit [Lasiodiplodia hormozganensis]|uniref:General transcription and DNA repair factor IIH n=1 Tax=Lasiodiplodia hormozganensis TaxID=869390 RepID=A0AA40CIE4_9PEZI|nr:TFIIH basal transcription factor complex p47 subunit [Lasiodiplodia hormozganensis]
MADSGDEYVYGSDDEGRGSRAGGKKKDRANGGRRWEQGVHADAHALKEAADGKLLPDEEDNPEAKKRKRLRQDTKPFQRGIIRHVVLVLDQSEAMLEKDFKPTRHGTREVIIVLGALLSLDPGDIFKTIASCVKNNVRVNIIGMGGRLKICQEICSRTNGGDENVYGVAVDQMHFRDLLLATTTPPVIRQTAAEVANPASLLKMGFPSRVVEAAPTICACHGILTRGGYLCSQCQAKVCSLPTGCPSCGLTLILSTHLARSYHHLFPLQNWSEVTWERARQVGSTECKSCLTPFPPVPSMSKAAAAAGKKSGANGERNGDSNGVQQEKRPKQTEGAGASESSRYECESCGNHFCVDCDVYCHEIVHNCPGCLSVVLPPDQAGGGKAVDGVASNGA